LKKLISSNESLEKVTGLSTLISLAGVANESSLNTIAVHFLQLVSLRNILSRDEDVIILASVALGKLLNAPTTTTFELADEQFRYALNTLKNDIGYPRFAACYEIKEMAQKIPILFAVYLGEFLNVMWNALRDQKDYIREAGLQTFSLALKQLESREELFEKVYSECFKGLYTENSPASVLGSLMVLKEMLDKNTLLLSFHLQDICLVLLKNKDHKTASIKQAFLEIIPSLVGFIYANKKYQDMNSCEILVDHIIKLASNTNKDLRAEAMSILGQIGMIAGNEFIRSINPATNIINIELKKKPLNPTVFELLRGLTKALGHRISEHFDINALVSTVISKQVFGAADLNVQMLDYLNELNKALLDSSDHKSRSYLYNICEKLLSLIYSVLNQRVEKNLTFPRNDTALLTSSTTYFNFTESFKLVKKQLFQPAGHIHVQETCYECGDHTEKMQIVLALFALSNFDFHNTFVLNSLISACVVPYLEDNCCVIRKYSVITTCILTKCPKSQNIGIILRNELYNTVERLLNVALTDQSDSVRHTLFKYLKQDFFQFLALESNLSRLMIAVNDKSIKVRRVCVKLLGKLVGFNSSFILPCMTQLLSQYLNELQISGRMKQQLDAAVLVRALIKYTRQLLSPNLASIIDIYIQILKSSQHPPLIYQALRAISTCAQVCKQQIIPFFQSIYPCLIENLKETSTLKRKGALLAILDVVTYTTKAIEPYLKFESLLETLLDVIKTEERTEIRKLSEKVLGKIGALDPVKYKELEKKNQSGIKSYKNSPVERHLRELHQKSLELTPSHDIYYPLVAIKALMNILNGVSSLTTDHIDQVLSALSNIFHCYSRQLNSLLENIIPILVHVCKQVDTNSRDRFITTFKNITSEVGESINDYVSEIITIIDLKVTSASSLNEMLSLLKELASHSCYDTMTNFPHLLHNCINILTTSNDDLVEKTLGLIECLKGKIDQYLYITIPALLKIVQDHTNVNIRKQAIRVIGLFCDKNIHPHIVDYISRIVDGFLTVIRNEYTDIVDNVFESFASIVESLGNLFAVFIPVIQRIMISRKISNKRYEAAVQNLIAGSEEVESPIRRVTNSNDLGASVGLENKIISSQAPYRHPVDVKQLLSVCSTNERQTKEEWKDWMRRISIELLKQAPAPALRECQVIEEYPNSLELFNASFVSCWSDLFDEDKNTMIKFLESAFESSIIPTEVLQVLLNLAEFMEHDDHKLFDARTLGKLAYKCKAYAKALHYKEVEFHNSAPNSEIIESLISLNNLLHQHEAANGIRIFAKKKGWGDLSQSWYQEFHRWQDAEEFHEAINEMLITEPVVANNEQITLIRMKCLKALSDWNKLMSLGEIKWNSIEKNESFRKEVASYAAAAAWNLGKWEELEKYSKEMDPANFEHNFFQAILSIHDNELEKSKKILNKAWDIVDTKLPGLLRESYIRAYPVVIEAQQLCDLEEVIYFKSEEETPERREDLLQLWNSRLRGSQPSIDIWEKFLSFRPLLVSPEEDLDTWTQFAELCMKNGQIKLAEDTLETLLLRSEGDTKTGSKIFFKIDGNEKIHPASVCFVYLKFLHSQDPKSLDYLIDFVEEQEKLNAPKTVLCKYYLQLTKWQKATMQEGFDKEIMSKVLNSIKTATQYDPTSHKAWHKWGILNFEALSYYERPSKQLSSENILKIMENHIYSAIEGFIHSIELEYSLTSSHKIQNLLRLITLWFKYGNKEKVNVKLKLGFEVLNVEVWLQVIPQIIARASTPDAELQDLIIDLLKKVAKHHPHALLYALTMAIRTNSAERIKVANSVLQEMREFHSSMVEDTLLVTEELIRCSVLWKEAWHEGISDASQLYFGGKDIPGMIAILKNLHEQLNCGPKTMNEVGFYQAFSADLTEAEFWMKRYEETKKEINLQQAWNTYYSVYLKLHKSNLREIELENVSPRLAEVQDLNATIPGIYRTNKEIVKIKKFDKNLKVFPTKQHPRKLSMIGGNGKEYQFLLKGHEDIRQDERAMQLFSLVNDLLAADRKTNGKDLAIRRYAVVPLSPTCGLIGWVHGSDTLNQLIQDYRQRKRIEIYVERDLIKTMYSKYEQLPLINKIEIFEYTMSQTKGEDLQKILWSKSPTSEIWLERRTNYTRSLATMSMVGYILGLGDRHPSNIMLDRYTGKIIHIDFGDCFEVAMKRERCPELVPFRLTRMMVNAMEISGTEGNFRNTCEQVMAVLRQNKDSLMAMLEVFLYEPLVSWRIIAQEKARPSHAEEAEDELSSNNIPRNFGTELEMTELLNKKAIEVLDRVIEKLTGNDFSDCKELSVTEQVDRLIKEARSIKNLSQSYIGWCPFW
jgi:serine/threonine-protein kinase mTOR